LFSVHPSPPHPDLRSFPTRRSSDLVYLGDSVLANLHQLPGLVADLLRAFPYDFLYGNIAADTSIAKKYAPVGRHCHAWHVGQEIDRKSTRLNSSHLGISYAVFCLKK